MKGLEHQIVEEEVEEDNHPVVGQDEFRTRDTQAESRRWLSYRDIAD